MEHLKSKGFLILRNVIPENKIKEAQLCINKKVNYSKLKPFLDEDVMGTLNKKLGTNLTYTKYRVSNNNNSSDAGNFHRDLQSYKPKEITNVFTCLAYLDTSYMELIKRSHKNVILPYNRINSFIKKNKIENKINPGDILIFYATTIHRGIFYKNETPNRRLIQLFDCVDVKDIPYFKESILHIPCKPNCSSKYANLLIKINKMKIGSDILNSVFILNIFRGYGYPYNGLKSITNDKKIRYLSTESNKDRLEIDYKKDKYRRSNMYIINNAVKDIDPNKRDSYIFYSFLIEMLLVLTIIILLIIVMTVVIVMISKTIRKYK